MVSCLIPEFPTVMIALERLKDLEKQLKEDGVAFAPEASIHLTEITAALSTLEAERRASHEHLEVETIENSNLRHQIDNLRKRISEGIVADVAAVRACNAKELDPLRRELRAALRLHEETSKRLHALLNQNKVLQPEREQIQAEKDAVVAALNDQLALKYSLQMRLDQTRGRIEELKSSIVSVEKQKDALQQTRRQVREAFPEKKDVVAREMDQIGEEINQQKEVIRIRRQELERVNRRREESHSYLGQLSLHISKQESSARKQTASRGCCEQLLEKEIQKHQELRRRRETLKEELQAMKEAFIRKVHDLNDNITRMEEKQEEGLKSGLLIQASLAQFSKVFKFRQVEENEVRAEYERVSQQLERSNLQLEERIAAIVRHSKGVKEMEKQIRELREEGVINRRVSKRDREELNFGLAAEKESVGRAEEEKRRLGRLLEEEARLQQEHAAQMASDIRGMRSRYEALLREEAESADADLLASRVAQSEAECRETESVYGREMQQILEEAESISRATEETQRALQEQEEALKEVEGKCSEEQSRNERLQELRCEATRKKSELDRSIQENKERIVSLLQPREAMKAQLEKLQSRFTDMLQEQAEELRQLEVDVYNDRTKMEEVGAENSRLHLRVIQMTEDVSTAKRHRDRNQRDTQQLTHNITVLLESLQEAWREDLSVTRDGQSRDAALLASMSLFLKHLQSRKQQLASVITLLHQQMLGFSKRLGDKTPLQHPESAARSQEAGPLCKRR